MDDGQDKDSIPKRPTLDKETGDPMMDIDRDENVSMPNDNDVNSGNIMGITVDPDDGATESKEAAMETVSETVKPVQQAKEKKMLQMSLGDSSDKQKSGESSDSTYVIVDHTYYNRNDKDDMDEDHSKDSTFQKNIHDSETGVPLVDAECCKTDSISGDNRNSGDVADVHLDDSKSENKETKPKTAFIPSSDTDNLEASSEPLTKRISREVQRFFRSHPIEVEGGSPLERRCQIITSSYFTDEFARDNGLTSPAITDDKVPEGFEQRLFEMMSHSKRLKKNLESTTKESSDVRRQSSPNLLEDIEATLDKASMNPAFSETTRPSPRSAASISDPSKSSSTGYPSSDLRGEQRQSSRLEDSSGDSIEKRSREDAVNLEIARKRLQELRVSGEEYIWHFPVIRRKYWNVDDDLPVPEPGDFMDPVIEQKITSVVCDMGQTVMTMLYDDFADKLMRSSKSCPSAKGEEKIKVVKVKALEQQTGLFKVPRPVKDPRTGSPDRHNATKTQLRLPSWASTKLASPSKSCKTFIRDSNIPPEIKIRYGQPTTDTSSRESGISPPAIGSRDEGNDSVQTPNMLNMGKTSQEQDNKPSTSSGGECGRYADPTMDIIPAIPHESVIPEEEKVGLEPHGDISESKQHFVVPRDDEKIEKTTTGAMGTSKDLKQEGADAKNNMELLQASSSREDSGGSQDLKESKASGSCDSSPTKEPVKRKDPLDKDISSGKDAKRRHFN